MLVLENSGSLIAQMIGHPPVVLSGHNYRAKGGKETHDESLRWNPHRSQSPII